MLAAVPLRQRVRHSLPDGGHWAVLAAVGHHLDRLPERLHQSAVLRRVHCLLHARRPLHLQVSLLLRPARGGGGAVRPGAPVRQGGQGEWRHWAGEPTARLPPVSPLSEAAFSGRRWLEKPVKGAIELLVSNMLKKNWKGVLLNALCVLQVEWLQGSQRLKPYCMHLLDNYRVTSKTFYMVNLNNGWSGSSNNYFFY